MIHSFKHKGLKKLFETGVKSGLKQEHAKRITFVLALLETANSPDDMALPGLNLHELKGNRKGTYAVNISGNGRITFQIKNGDIFNVNDEDYH